MKPLLFMDVDGVLNCFRDDGEMFNAGTADWCCVPPGTQDRLKILVKHFDPVWATAWFGRANVLREPLNLGPKPWPHIEWNQFKLTEILKFAKDRPWAWVDDDANFELDELGWTTLMVPGLVVEPDPNFGLNDQHVEQLVQYAKQVSQP